MYKSWPLKIGGPLAYRLTRRSWNFELLHFVAQPTSHVSLTPTSWVCNKKKKNKFQNKLSRHLCQVITYRSPKARWNILKSSGDKSTYTYGRGVINDKADKAAFRYVKPISQQGGGADYAHPLALPHLKNSLITPLVRIVGKSHTKYLGLLYLAKVAPLPQFFKISQGLES